MKKKVLWYIFVCIVLLEIGFTVLINRLQSVSGYGILDAMFYNKDIVETVIHAYGSKGIDIYYQIQVLDFVFPMMYGTLLAGLLYKSKLMMIPVIAALMDYGENICIRMMLNSYPNIADIATISFCFTVMKYILITASIGIIVVSRLTLRRKVHQ